MLCSMSRWKYRGIKAATLISLLASIYWSHTRTPSVHSEGKLIGLAVPILSEGTARRRWVSFQVSPSSINIPGGVSSAPCCFREASPDLNFMPDDNVETDKAQGNRAHLSSLAARVIYFKHPLTGSKRRSLFIINITLVPDCEWERKRRTATEQVLYFAHQPVWLDVLEGERKKERMRGRKKGTGGMRERGRELSIRTWQLLYVWNALALIAVPLGERREALYRWRERERGVGWGERWWEKEPSSRPFTVIIIL